MSLTTGGNKPAQLDGLEILPTRQLTYRDDDFQELDTSGIDVYSTVIVQHLASLGNVIAGPRGWTEVPILVFSARHGSHDKAETLDAGAGDYVTKPFGLDELLTPAEWSVLELLVRNPGRLVSQQHILTQVSGLAYAKGTHYLRVYMAQPRCKLEQDPAAPAHLLTEARHRIAP